MEDRRWRALGVLAVGLSLIVLDGTIVGVALPAIIADLGLDLTDAQWVNSLYAVVFAALLLAAGRLGDRLGRKRLFVAGVALFVGGSLLAALAGDPAMLVASRAVQGIGGACVLPSTLSTVNATFRGRDRAAAFGLWGAVMSGMAAVGPLLGGALTTWFDWRWVFLVNLPLGALVVAAALAWVPETRGESAPGADVVGLLLSAVGFGALVLGLIEGTTLGWWRPAVSMDVGPLTWPASAPVSLPAVALGAGLLGVAAFLAWERRRARQERSALLDLGLFRLPSFGWGNLTAAVVGVAEFALVLVLPLHLVNVVGLDIMGTGLVLAAMALGAFASGAMARHLAARLGAPRVVLLGLALELVGVLVLALTLGPATEPGVVAATLAVYGVGLGLAAAQLTSVVLAEVPPGRSGTASATQSTVRQLGAGLGSALGGTALALGLAAALPGRLAGLGLAASDVGDLVAGTTLSAGSNIQPLFGLGSGGEFGDLTPRIAEALAAGFADATRAALGVAVVFLALGVAGAVMVGRPGEGDAYPPSEGC